MAPLGITQPELDDLAPSLQEFQRGESSDGRHFMGRGFAYALRSGDQNYLTALDLFIKEEQRHGNYLGRYLTAAGVPLLTQTSTDSIFRALRRMGGLEGMITVLITAELIACVYYKAIQAATGSPLLQDLCAQILRDEDRHIRFQAERLALMRRQRSQLMTGVTTVLHTVLLCGALVFIWPRHGKAIQRGGYSFFRFAAETMGVFMNTCSRYWCTQLDQHSGTRLPARAALRRI